MRALQTTSHRVSPGEATFVPEGGRTWRAAVPGAFAAVLLFLLSATSRANAANSTNELQQLQRQCEDLIVGQSKLAEAGPVVAKLLALTLENRGECHQDTVVALHWAAFLAQQAGRHAEAEQTWQRSLAVQEKLPEKDLVWFTRTLHMLAGVARATYDLPAAERYLKRALEMREQALGPDHPETAQVVHSLARLAKTRGDIGQAELLFARALAAFERAGAGYEDGLAAVLESLGGFYLNMGDLDKAEPLMARSYLVNEKLYGPVHARTINSLNGLGTIRRYRGDLPGAGAIYRRTLRLREKLNGRDAIVLQWPLHQLAEIHLELDQLSDAEGLLQRMLDIIRAKLGPEDPSLATALNTLGKLHERRGDYQNASRCFEHALKLAERHPGPTHFSTTEYRRSLGRVQFLLGHPEVAMAAADLIQTGEEKHTAETFAFTSERQRLIFHERWIQHDRYDLWATMGAATPLARAVLRTKGSVLDSLLEDGLLAEAANDPELRRLAEELARLKLRLAHLSSMNAAPGAFVIEPANADVTEFELATRQLESLEATLARKVGGLGRGHRAFMVTTEGVRGALPGNAALIEFLRYDHYSGRGNSIASYGALIVLREQEPIWVRLADAKVIEKNLKLYQHLTRRRTDNGSLVDLLGELQRQLWAPVAKVLPTTIRQIILCPDGPLNFLSFATLLTSSNRFLAEDFDLSYVSSGRDLLAEKATRSGTRDLLVWANPDFEVANASSPPSAAMAATGEMGQAEVIRGLDFRALPGAETEGRWLTEHATDFAFDQASLFLGRNATEARLTRVQSPSVLHFATHGFVFPPANRPRPGAGPSEGCPDTPSACAKSLNPMHYSGLALAGAKHTLDSWAKGDAVPPDNDGIVSAAEIGCLNLKGTQLVVLSACDTGLGQALAGEGVLGLRRGFIQAGAQSLLLTLWAIADEQTAKFVPEFYQAAHKTGNPAEALAIVQRSWLKRLRKEKGTAEACVVAGPFILNFQGTPGVRR